MITLYPVLRPFASAVARSQRFTAARGAAQEALVASARRAGGPRALPGGLRLADWPRDARGAPRPLNGWHLSFADTSGAAVGIVAPVPCAVDIECLERPRWEAARTRFHEDGDLARLGDDARPAVLALWTAKEAVLKLAGIGLADLGRVPLLARTAQGFRLAHGGREHEVWVRPVGAHLVAVACAVAARVELARLPLDAADPEAVGA